MNIQFRDFLLRINVVDESKQKLVAQLGKVFAYMQNSYERYIDPTLAVESIAIPGMQGQDEQIDVAVQMDVDEFYNILFDQIERQILDPELRRRFKSLYGGQLVQQVKSRECEHISERVEPFSNIQIEIKGKRGLEDGLKAYVEGEVLQGDNKYSCTSCGKHVDAVKRACLKDVPDNLIFNLKRFDYDIMTGTRCKINDEFQFPDTIDMAPYTVEYLSNPEKAIPPDNFELTGVIVHAGTADSGHYYSYIRQRPSSKDKVDSWVQFNDTEVNSFDPASLKDNCFGGIDMGSTFQWPKIYSAYMLFYQRSSSIKKFEKKYTQHDLLNPVRLPLSGDLERHLRQQNELFIRCYCAQDPSHAKFMRRLLERIQNNPDKWCQPEHHFESKLLLVVLEYIQQVSSRWKEHPEFESTIKILKSNASRCTNCAATILDWYVREDIVSSSMLRSPYPLVRKSFVALLCQALSRVSKDAKEAELKIAEETGQTGLFKGYERTFRELITQVIELWDDFQRYGRAWNDYFDLLTSLIKLGYDEAWTVLEAKALELVLELVLVHSGPVTKKLKSKYQQFLTLREKNRVFGLSSFIECLEALLGWLDLKHISNGDVRYRDDQGFGVTYFEASYLGLVGPPARNSAEFEWLRRLIIGRQNQLATHRIVRHLIRDHSLVRHVCRVLEVGLGDENIGNAVSFLEPTLLFCSHCTMQPFITKLIRASLEGIETIGSQYGKEHLEYVMTLLKNENEDLDLMPEYFEREIVMTVGSWAPVLLIYPNSDLHLDVRRDTAELLNCLIFTPLASGTLEPQDSAYLRRAAKKLALAGAQHTTKNYIDAPPKECSVLQAGQASVFFEIMDQCLTYFDMTNAQEEHQVTEITEALDALKLKADAAVETFSSSWQDGESDVGDVSEMYQSDIGSP
jgi:ubiquitin carboxyl-terminal hydrolase 34